MLGSVAMMSSVTVSSARRCRSSRIDRSSGPTRPSGDRAAEHVVGPPELAGPLDRHDVLGLLDDADLRLVASRVGADPAELRLGDVAAARTEADRRLDLGEDGRQPGDLLRVGAQQMERDPLGRLRADPRKSPQLVDEVLDHALVHGVSLGGAGVTPEQVGHSAGWRFSDQRSSIRPTRQTSRATTHVTTKSPTIQ